MAIQAEVQRRRFTRQEYHRMAEAGILHEDELQPDIVLLRPRPDRYLEDDAHPADGLLLVEVADTSQLRPDGQASPLCSGRGAGSVDH
jgi:hypothetical protein